jgi:hypothetical protein
MGGAERDRKTLKVCSYLAGLWGVDAGDGGIKGQAKASVVEK